MEKNKSSINMGDKINSYGQQTYLTADQITPLPVSQENVQLTPNYTQHLQKLIYSVPVVNNSNNMDSDMSKMLGSLTSVNQVNFSDTSADTTNQTSSLNYVLASSNASSGASFQAASKNKKNSSEVRKDEWAKEDGYWVYFNEDGRMVKSDFVENGNNTYYMDKNGHMVTGFQTIKKKNYYFDSSGRMQKGQQRINNDQYYFDSDGVKIEIYYIDDFIFESTKDKKEKKENEDLANEAMKLHQEYHEHTAQKKYATQGSILACTYGSKLTCLDTSATADICDIGTGLPILGCNACKAEENIKSFYSCRVPDNPYMLKREVMNDGNKKCIPLLDGLWLQTDDTPVMWNSVSGECTYALKESSGIMCRYGGRIGIIEVPEKAVEDLGIYDLNGMNVDKKALEIMEKMYKENTNIKTMVDGDGLSIFAMEGLGENSGQGIPSLFPNGRYGAVLVVTKGNVVKFVTNHATTLPSALELEGYEKGTSTLMEGVYYIHGKNHQNKYPAFALNTEFEQLYDNMPVTRKVLGESRSYKTTGDSINLHTAPNDTGPLYSEGCQMIRSQDYIDFLFITGLAKEDDKYANFLRGMSIDSSLVFRGENVHPTGNQTLKEDNDGKKYDRNSYGMKGMDGKYYWYIELLSEIKLNIDNLPKGYYVLDRTYMPQSQKERFYI